MSKPAMTKRGSARHKEPRNVLSADGSNHYTNGPNNHNEPNSYNEISNYTKDTSQNVDQDPMEFPKQPPNQPPKHPTLLKTLQTFSLVLDNRGSVARDHLANERTFLAWARTAMVMMTLGLAFIQLYSIQLRAHEAVYNSSTYTLKASHGVEGLKVAGRPFGVLIGVFALITMAFGFYRYVAVQSGLRHGEFPATRFLVAVVLLMCVLSMVLILVMDIKSL